MALLEVRDLVVRYKVRSNAFSPKRDLFAVNRVSFDLDHGETLGLVGESGCGKSTLGRAVVRLEPPTSGQVLVDGKDLYKLSGAELKKLRGRYQMIFQDPYGSLNPRLTVFSALDEVLSMQGTLNAKERRERAEALLDRVGLPPSALSRFPHQFSGGQRQRIGIARSLIMKPEFIVADEPISALDVSIRAQILNLMKKFQAERDITYLFIAHDLSIVRFISDRIVVIYKGRIMEIAETEELFAYPLHPYTKSLMSAIPVPDPQIEKEKQLFVYDKHMHDYSKEQPSLVDIGNGHFVFGSPSEIEKYKEIRYPSGK